MVKTINNMPASPTTSTPKTANKLDVYTALGGASDTFNFPDYLGMHASLYLTKVTGTSFKRSRPLQKDEETITLCPSSLPF